MFGFGKRETAAQGPRISTRLCTDKFNGKYPTVGLFDCRERKVWVCTPVRGARLHPHSLALITGSRQRRQHCLARKDRFLCFWFYTPNTGEGFIHGYPIEWDEAHLLVRTDSSWDYDRQRIIPPELEDQLNENLERQHRQGERIMEFFKAAKLRYRWPSISSASAYPIRSSVCATRRRFKNSKC